MPQGSAAASLSASSPQILISEFYPCALCDDEYVTLVSTSYETVPLAGWSVSDGEGSITFLPGAFIGPSEEMVISFNSSSYLSAYSSLPDVRLDDASSSSLVDVSGTFRLADDGDSLSLVSPTGTVEDFVPYGDCADRAGAWSGDPVPALRAGEVAKRMSVSGAAVDTDSAADWTPFREYRYGYTEFSPVTDTVPAGGMTAFTSPDCSLDVVLSELDSARYSVKACAYEVYSGPVCRALLSALGRGVSVDVLVDGSPAGGMDGRQVVCLSVLASAGAAVRTVSGSVSEDTVRHVFAMHSKYIVVDGSRCVVLSENLVESGVPSDRLFGNRGWGVALTSPRLAAFLSALFDEDSRRSRPDVLAWTDDPRFLPSAVLPAVVESRHPEGVLQPFTPDEPATVTLVPSPDGSVSGPFLASPLRQARSLIVEQFQADLEWDSRWSGASSTNPLLESIVSSLAAGGSAEALFDSSWFNLERNEPVVDYLDNSSLGLDGQFELLDQASPYTALHNKGLVIDSRVSVVSSNNWVSASFSRNRELAAFVDSVQVASYYSRAFGLDWIPDTTPPAIVVSGPCAMDVGTSVTLDATPSRDDRAIANISWDIWSDGTIDAWGACCTLSASVPGPLRVRVIVEDCWGNTAYELVVVEVVAAGEETASGPGGGGLPDLSWAVPLAIGGAILVPRLVRHRRRRRPRKVNLPRAGSHR